MKVDKVWNALNPPQFLESFQYSDCVIIAQDGEVLAHKFMLGAASPLLKKFMLVSEGLDQNTVLHLPDFQIFEIKCLLDIIYGVNTSDISNQVRRSFQCLKLFDQVFQNDRDFPSSLPEVKEEAIENTFDKFESNQDQDDNSITSKLRRTRPRRSMKNLNFEIKSEDEEVLPETKKPAKKRGRPAKRKIPSNSNSNSTENKKVVCPDCRQAVAVEEFAEHMSTMHADTDEELEEEDENNLPVKVKDNQRSKCEECGKRVLKHCLAAHMAKKHLKKAEYECCDCEQRFHLQTDFDHHISFQHSSSEGKKCKHCAKSYALQKLEKLELHEFQCMPLPPPPRAGKYKNRRKQAPITNIEVKLNEENPNVCPYEGCKYMNARTSRVKSHYISRHCRQKCPYCGNILAVTSLEQHIIMQHTKQFSFVCHICSKGFVKQSLLTHHIDEEHIKELKHICDDCGKGFYSKLKLNTHKYWAHKNNDWRCEPCSKKYTCQGALIKHLKRHHNGEGIDKLYKNEKGEYKQVRNYKHVTDNSLMIQTVNNAIMLDNHSTLDPFSGANFGQPMADDDKNFENEATKLVTNSLDNNLHQVMPL